MKILLIYLIFIISSQSLLTQRCYEKLILDGSDVFVNCGFDTTDNFYAISSPFTNKYKIKINSDYISEALDYLTIPVFSADGSKWAFEGLFNGVLKLYTKDTSIILGNYKFGNLYFSYESNDLVFTYSNESQEVINYRGKKIISNNRNSDIYLSSNGDQIAFVVRLGVKEFLLVNGKEIASDNDIIPIGFWENGEFVYVLFDGLQYSLYIGSKRLESNKREIGNVKINTKCNFMVYSYVTLSGQSFVSSYSDKYYEQITGRAYDFVNNLIIHPFEEMFAYCAGEQNKMYVVFNNTAYPAGNNIVKPKFTNDGKELYFIGCEDNNCFININGLQTKLKGPYLTETDYYMKSSSKTFAFLSSTHLTMMNLEDKTQYAGKMMDKLISIRFNPYKNRYEGFGLINNSLWLLSCE